MEIDFHGHFHIHRVTIFLAGFEAPGLDRLDGFLVESHAQRVHHANVRGLAVGANDNHQGANSLVLSFARFFGELRIRREDWPRRGHTSARAVNTASHTHALTGSDAAPVTGADTTTRARTDARTLPRTIRRNDGGRFRVAKVWHAVHSHLDIRRHHHRRLNRQLGVHVSNHCCRRSDLASSKTSAVFPAKPLTRRGRHHHRRRRPASSPASAGYNHRDQSARSPLAWPRPLLPGAARKSYRQ